MGRIEITLLSQKDILGLDVGIGKIISLVEAGMAEHGRGRVENPPKPGLHATSNSFIHAMPAYFKDLGIGGMKWVAGYPDNRAVGLPQIIGTLILNDMKTGAPLCLMDATWITAVRTAATSAVTGKYCARKDARVLGVVGAGVQGRYHLIALKEVLPSLSLAKVTDVDRRSAESFRKELGKRTGVEITVCDDVESVARGSDIIVTATQRLREPLIRDEWFGKGCLGLGLEIARAWYGEALHNADKFVTDDWEQAKHFDSQGAFPSGLPSRHLELGRIVTGQVNGRDQEGERILAINTGLALADVIVAHHVYEIASKRGGYPTVTLMEY
jgi:ornithine cyclodeaminase/alanine dehydrogenase-like protein (mu-crystallin family)